MYTVLWTGDALKQLTDLRRHSRDNEAITLSVAQIDAALASAPYEGGVHISEGLYRIGINPLIASYSVQESQQIVEVGHVRWFRLIELN